MQPGIDATRPHLARVYDYYLGGRGHFPVDRETGERAMQSWPAVRTAVRENRAFLGRAVRYLAADAGIRQFLASSAVRQTLDLSRPVALMLVAVLHFLPDAEDPAPLIATVLDALAPGSFLVASHVTPEHDPDGVGGLERTYRQGGIPAQARTAAEFAALAFSGLDLVDPGVVLVSEWRPAGGPRPSAAEVSWYGGIGRKAG
jgi:hypothetical protein